MKYKRRALADKIVSMSNHFSVVVISGARQVGKSTLLQQHFPDWDLVVFDPVQDIGNAREDPDLFLKNHPKPIILDEIQYCPELVPCIKRMVDKDKKAGMFILTGSQQWSVLKSISESLAGRAVFVDLEGFSLCEKHQITNDDLWLEDYLTNPHDFTKNKTSRSSLQLVPNEELWRGSLPEADKLPPEFIHDFFASYLRTYIERDVRLILDAADWQQFGRFVILTSALTAQEVNYSELGREIGITPQTAKRWLNALIATFQYYEIPAYHSNTIKRISGKPKGFFADTGLLCHLNAISSPNTISGHPLSGALWETLIVSEIRKQLSLLASKPQMYHWRLHSGAEVDLLLEIDNKLYPIEIKLTSKPSKKHCRGFQSFRECYPRKEIAPGLVICVTEKLEQISQYDFCIPWDIV